MRRSEQPYTLLSTARHLRPRSIYVKVPLIILLSLPLSVFILGTILYLLPENQYMRICVPFSLSKISASAHRKLSCQYSASAGPSSGTVLNMSGSQEEVQPGRLAGFLQSQKELFLGDLKDGKGKGWTVAMGNEAGGKPSCSRTPSWTEGLNPRNRFGYDSIINRLFIPLLNATRRTSRPTPLNTFKSDEPPTGESSSSQTLTYPTLNTATLGVYLYYRPFDARCEFRSGRS